MSLYIDASKLHLCELTREIFELFSKSAKQSNQIKINLSKDDNAYIDDSHLVLNIQDCKSKINFKSISKIVLNNKSIDLSYIRGVLK